MPDQTPAPDYETRLAVYIAEVARLSAALETERAINRDLSLALAAAEKTRTQAEITIAAEREEIRERSEKLARAYRRANEAADDVERSKIETDAMMRSHQTQARVYCEKFEGLRKSIKSTLTAPLEKRGIDTRAMPPEAMLARVASLLKMRGEGSIDALLRENVAMRAALVFRPLGRA